MNKTAVFLTLCKLLLEWHSVKLMSKTPANGDALYKHEKNGRSIVWEYIPIRKKMRFKSGSVCKQEYRERLTNHELPEVHTVLRINKKHPVHVFSACVGCFQVTSLLWDILYFLTCFLVMGWINWIARTGVFQRKMKSEERIVKNKNSSVKDRGFLAEREGFEPSFGY